MKGNKKKVEEFWNEASCGENLLLEESSKDGYEKQSKERYKLEPYIIPFAEFDKTSGKDVLEIGVGLGADHQKFAEYGANLSGIYLTQRAINHTSERLRCFNLESKLRISDVEKLDFKDGLFDLVYSWGGDSSYPEYTSCYRAYITSSQAWRTS